MLLCPQWHSLSSYCKLLMICRKLSYTWKGRLINPRSRASGSVSPCVYVCGRAFRVCVRGNEQMAQCAMSCYVIIMEHAWGKLGEGKEKKKVLMSSGECVFLCEWSKERRGCVVCVGGCSGVLPAEGWKRKWTRVEVESSHHNHHTSTTAYYDSCYFQRYY